jgi:hypothetical protein
MKNLLLPIFVIISLDLVAQKPAEIFSYYRDSLPAQHIYLHFDKQAYLPGDTAWFKAYLYSSYGPSTISSNLFVDLLDDKGNILITKKLPILEGTAIGNFEFAPTLKQAIYIIRAYTTWQKNFDQSFIFKKAIPVFNPNDQRSIIKSKTEFNFQFFPEGGVLVADLPNNIAFIATNEKSEMIPVTAELVDGKGKKIGDFANGQGSGVFSLTPVFKEKYFAQVTFPDKSTKKIEFPEAVYKKATLTVADEENGKSFSALLSPGYLSEGEQVELVAVMDQQMVLDTKVPVKNNEALGLISTKNLRPGIMHVYLFDERNNFLAEKTTLVQSKKLLQDVVLKVDELGKAAKAKNILSFEFPETINGSFSVSVTDADRELPSIGNSDIFSSLLIQSGSAKIISNPKPANEEDADILVISNKWWGSNWPMLAKKIPVADDKDNFLSWNGRLYTDDGSAAVANGNLKLIVQPKNFMQKTYYVESGNNGEFDLDSLIFEDSARIFYQLVTSKQTKKVAAVKIILDEKTEDFSALMKNMDFSFSKAAATVFENNAAQQLAADIQRLQLAAKQKKDIRPNRADQKNAENKSATERYMGGLFAASNGKTIDFISNPPDRRNLNIFEYLQGQVGGLMIEKVNSGYNLWSARSVSIGEVVRGNRKGLVPGKVYLNEQESTSDAVMRIPIDQIALVKYFEPGSIQLPGVGMSPVLAFWTKTQEDQGVDVASDMKNITVAGYSPARRFYSPDYSSSKNTPDIRTTLFWDPHIIVTDDNKFTISFYNSDLAKRFHVVLEGFTAEGKLVRLEKVVE